jgi:hypothetical protein
MRYSISKSNGRHRRLISEWSRSYCDGEEKEKAIRRYLEQTSTTTLTVVPGETEQILPVVSLSRGWNASVAHSPTARPAARYSLQLDQERSQNPYFALTTQAVPNSHRPKSRQAREKTVTKKESGLPMGTCGLQPSTDESG